MASQWSAAQGALGLNYNESPTWINNAELNLVNAQWTRGFLDMHSIDSINIDQDPNLNALLDAGDAGFNTILSLKWPYGNLDIPDPGSSELNAELDRLEDLLAFALCKVDILVIGNEPFIEAKPDQPEEPLNVFYETLADSVIDFWKLQPSCGTRLYMGAFNRLDLPAKRTAGVERMLAYIASKTELDGADLHLHMADFAGHQSMLEYALARIRPDQTFLATEFSMIWWWKQHMSDVVSSYFRTKYSLAAGTLVYQALNLGIQQPWPFAKWQEFLSHEPWYTQYQDFLSDAIELYRSTGRLEVATYSYCAMCDRKTPLVASDTPWLFNGVYAPSTVQVASDGSKHENFPWAEEFRQAQS